MRTRLRNFLNYMMLIGIWSLCGSIHYLLASFASLSIDFRDWPPNARWVFAGIGIGAIILGNLLYAAELFKWEKVVLVEDDTDEDE